MSLGVVEAYYKAMAEKNVAEMGKYLHPEVVLVGPLAAVEGKEAVLNAAERFATLVQKLTIRAKFGSEDQAMLAIDFNCPEPIGTIRGAVLILLHEGLIIRNELFFDPRSVEQDKDEIYHGK